MSLNFGNLIALCKKEIKPKKEDRLSTQSKQDSILNYNPQSKNEGFKLEQTVI